MKSEHVVWMLIRAWPWKWPSTRMHSLPHSVCLYVPPRLQPSLTQSAGMLTNPRALPNWTQGFTGPSIELYPSHPTQIQSPQRNVLEPPARQTCTQWTQTLCFLFGFAWCSSGIVCYLTVVEGILQKVFKEEQSYWNLLRSWALSMNAWGSRLKH